MFFVPSTTWGIQLYVRTLARSQSTRRGRQRSAEEVKATRSVAGHLLLVQHANAGFGQSRTQKQIDVASRIGHSPGLTTQRAVRYGGSSARRAQDRLSCGVDYRVHHPVRRGREALRQAQSYGCAVVVRGVSSSRHRHRPSPRPRPRLPASLLCRPELVLAWPGNLRRGYSSSGGF